MKVNFFKEKLILLLMISLASAILGCKTIYSAVDVSAFDRKANISVNIAGCYRYENITDPNYKQLDSGYVLILQHEKNNYLEMLFFVNENEMKTALENLKKGQSISSIDGFCDYRNEIFYGYYNKNNNSFSFSQKGGASVAFSNVYSGNRYINLSLKDNSKDLIGIYNFNDSSTTHNTTQDKLIITTTMRAGEYLINFVKLSN